MPEYNITFDWNRISTLGKVKVLVEQVVGAPSQSAINTAVAQYIESHPGSLSPLSPEVKAALLQIAEKVAYIDEHGEDYYNALDAALNAKALLQITAVYTQSGTVYDTDSLDSLKADLVVTAYYDDSTSAVVTNGYTLSGTLAEGTSTITVTFEGKTATFTVVVDNGYQMVEYLVSAQDCYVPIGMRTLPSVGFYADFEITSRYNKYGPSLLTSANNETEGGRLLTVNCRTYSNGTYINFAGTNNYGTLGTIPLNQRVQMYINTNNDNKFTMPALSVDTTLTKGAVTSGDMTLFQDMGAPEQSYNLIGKLYKMELYSAGVKMVDLAPCYRKRDNVIGLLDTLTNTFFTNAGAGSFDKGGDI